MTCTPAIPFIPRRARINSTQILAPSRFWSADCSIRCRICSGMCTPGTWVRVQRPRPCARAGGISASRCGAGQLFAFQTIGPAGGLICIKLYDNAGAWERAHEPRLACRPMLQPEPATPEPDRSPWTGTRSTVTSERCSFAAFQNDQTYKTPPEASGTGGIAVKRATASPTGATAVQVRPAVRQACPRLRRFVVHPFVRPLLLGYDLPSYLPVRKCRNMCSCRAALFPRWGRG